MIPWLSSNDLFPPVSQALAEPSGLLAASDDLSAERLITAYRQGIFPWYSEGQPVLWWSTHPRMVLFTDELRVSHSLSKTLQRARQNTSVEIRCDHAFEQVMQACAAPRNGQAGTWISRAIIDAYTELHRRKLAHSVETWVNGRLVGGLYGVCIGKMFYGESMFTHVTDASKMALVHLTEFLHLQGFPMIDCQQVTSHLASFGARPIDRKDFVGRVAKLVDQTGVADWPQRLDISSISSPPVNRR